jgi:hypothetical protein
VADSDDQHEVEDEPIARTFWKTPSGVVAISTLITAIVGALTLIVSLTDSDAEAPATTLPASPTTPTSTAGPSMPPTPHERLLAHIPPEIATGCGRMDTLVGTSLAGVYCRGPAFPGEGYVFFYLFGNREEMYAFFTPRLEIRETPAGATCGDDPAGESTYSTGTDDRAGYLLCFEQDGERYLEWTHDAFAIYAWIRSTASSEEIFDFWQDAGPISPEVPASPSGSSE